MATYCWNCQLIKFISISLCVRLHHLSSNAFSILSTSRSVISSFPNLFLFLLVVMNFSLISMRFGGVLGIYMSTSISFVSSSFACFITKTCLYNFDPLKPHFYIVKLGFTGVYIIFLISAEKHILWVLVRTASRGSSNEYPQSMFWAEIWKLSEFLSENFLFFFFFFFLVVKFSVYLNRRVFVMLSLVLEWLHCEELLRR